MEGTHTPGPWETYETQAEHIKIVGSDQSKSYRMVPICTPYEIKKKPGEMKANAKLIAAAPELLEVLTEFMKWYESLPENENLPKGMTLKMWINASNTIKKATI